jgi:channel protein (hemolysin III family)
VPTTDLLSIPGFADPVSSLTHLFGAAAALAAGLPLVRRGLGARDLPGSERHTLRIVSLVVFAASATVLLSMSGVYHMLTHGAPARDVLQRLDHAAIFGLIAGTATPVYAIMFRGMWRWGMLVLLWVLAILGVTLKSIYFNSTPQGFGVAMYVGMGWLAGVAMILLARRYGVRFVLPLFVGGVIYTAGAAVEWLEPPALIRNVFRAHELFHLAVLGGLYYQWRFIWTIAGMEGSETRPPGSEAPEPVVIIGAKARDTKPGYEPLGVLEPRNGG